MALAMTTARIMRDCVRRCTAPTRRIGKVLELLEGEGDARIDVIRGDLGSWDGAAGHRAQRESYTSSR